MNIIITGGAGFIGSNTTAYFLKKKHNVIVFDNLSRDGSRKNLAWIKGMYPQVTMIKGDVRRVSDVDKLAPYIKSADAIIHLAAQVAVTTSVINPREDFDINALGTLNILELARTHEARAKIIYASTNKVYGNMEEVGVKEQKTRYTYALLPRGVSETQPLDFHSPYGCSKGVADQYTHDYGRIYGLDTVVFRQSCIYGPRQFGVEDQGWVAWFLIALTLGKRMTIYGNGKQVRDLLHVDDLVRAYDAAIRNKKKTRGGIYNIGGGSQNTMSVWSEFGPILEELFEKPIRVRFDDWRPGDQPVFIADISKAKKEFGWEPTIGVKDGIAQLYRWVGDNKHLFV